MVFPPFFYIASASSLKKINSMLCYIRFDNRHKTQRVCGMNEYGEKQQDKSGVKTLRFSRQGVRGGDTSMPMFGLSP